MAVKVCLQERAMPGAVVGEYGFFITDNLGGLVLLTPLPHIDAEATR